MGHKANNWQVWLGRYALHHKYERVVRAHCYNQLGIAQARACVRACVRARVRARAHLRHYCRIGRIPAGADGHVCSYTEPAR